MESVGKPTRPLAEPATGPSDIASTESPVTQKGAWMALGRIVDQGALGIIGLVLAARVSVENFAVLAALLVGYSVSATLGDLGLGHELLRLKPGDTADRKMLTRVRLVAGLCLVIGAVGLLANLELVGWIFVLWALNSEAALRQSSAMLNHEHRRIGIAQAAAGLLLVVIVVWFPADLRTLGVALAIRAGVELISLPALGQWFSDHPTMKLSPLPVLASHTTGYGTRNVDFFVAGPILGTVSFGLYVFAFRLANAAFAPLGALTTRLGIAELSQNRSDLDRQYNRGLRILLRAGVVMTGLTIAAAQLLPVVVGQRWKPAVVIIVVLAAALPWRFIDGLIGPVLYVSDNHAMSVRVEVARLIATSLVVLAAAPAGAEALALANTVATIATVWGGHRLAAAKASIGTPGGFNGAAIASIMIAFGLWFLFR